MKTTAMPVTRELGAKPMKARRGAAVKSVIARGRLSKAQVFRGKKERTVGGLKSGDIVRNRYGKLVSKKVSARFKNNAWAKAIAAARKALGLKGFILINKGPTGEALYAKAKTIMEQQKQQ